MPDPENLRAKMPLSNMQIGQKAVDKGAGINDPELIQQGYAIQTMAVHVQTKIPECQKSLNGRLLRWP